MQKIKNQVILITGATDGLGKRVAFDLAARDATILLHGRSPGKGQAILQQIRDATGNPKLIYYNADFSSLDAVRQLSEKIQADQKRLDVLINNAGIGAVNSLHPASLMDTKMVIETDYFGGPVSTVDEGAQAVTYLAASPELEGISGEYFNGKQRSRANPQAYDEPARRQLRTLSEQLTHMRDL